MNKIKNIAAFTSIRSEYGLLKPVLSRIFSDKDLQLSLLVGGAHLSHKYGYTINQIKEDGFNIAQILDFLEDSNDPGYITRSMGKLLEQSGEWLQNNLPDLLLIIGDRFELISIASAALLLNIPIAHISGGEVTEGSIDNQIRHAISKMSHLHFPATEVYRKNLLKLGEEDWRICVSGEPGLDEIGSMHLYGKDELFNELGLDIKVPVICLTLHPETINNAITDSFLEALINKLLFETSYQIVATASNFDEGGQAINLMIEKLAKRNNRLIYIKSLGQKRYYSLLKHASLMMGNSSSGIIEAQSFKIPVIDIGNRQKGRLSNKNIIHVKIDLNEIMKALSYGLSSDFHEKYYMEANIYSKGNASGIIVDFIKSIDSDLLLLKKDSFISDT